jgi:AcrR family transcriptional regulator
MKTVRAREPWTDKASPPRTADRIRAAAEDLFCRRSFEAVSVADIAAQAGVNKALVFYHFDSKARLFDLVLEGYYEAHTAALARALDRDGSTAERLHRMVDAYLDFMIENRRYASLIQLQASEPATRPLIRRHVEPLFRLVRDALEGVTPSKGPLSARQIYVTFAGMVTSYFTAAPLIEDAWGKGGPMGASALRERREHVHWMVDMMLTRIDAARSA